MESLNILAETDHWLAVEKPAHMTIHNRKGEDVLSLLEQAGYGDAHAVHRLDAGTSGVLLVAKDVQSSKSLHSLFADREITKHYLARAVVQRGENPRVGTGGLWTWSLTKKAESRRNPRGWSGARVPCRTRFEVLAAQDNEVLLECFPETGRKHQIRRHAAICGWPLVGDYRYGPGSREGEEEQPMGLHAFRLSFVDPWTGDDVVLEAPIPTWMERGLR